MKNKVSKVNLEEMEKTYLNLSQQIELLKTQKDFLRGGIIKEMEKRGIKKGNLLQLVLQNRVELDHLMLKASLSKMLWNSLTADKVDPTKLEAAVRAGRVEAGLVEKASRHSTVKQLYPLR